MGMQSTYLDRRVNICDVRNSGLKNYKGLEKFNLEDLENKAKSVACMTFKEFLTKNGPYYQFSKNVQSLSSRLSEIYGTPFGEDELFKDEPILGQATAFLVAPDLVLTTAHVVALCRSLLEQESELKKFRFVFGFKMEDKSNCKNVFEKSDVYKLKKVVAYCYDRKSKRDWALIRLTKEVVGRTPLPLDFNEVSEEADVYIMGHPSGLPLKLSYGAQVINSKSPNYFEVKMDSAPKGSSGSPVFLNNKVVGILFAGPAKTSELQNISYDITNNYRGRNKRRCYTVTSHHIMSKNDRPYYLCNQISQLEIVQMYLQKYENKSRNIINGDLCYKIGNFYLNAIMNDLVQGTYRERAMNKAFKHLNKAFEKGSLQALPKLGLCYERGYGTDADPIKAFQCHQKGYVLEVPESLYQLFRCFDQGIGAYADKSEAKKYFMEGVRKEAPNFPKPLIRLKWLW